MFARSSISRTYSVLMRLALLTLAQNPCENDVTLSSNVITQGSVEGS